MKFFFDTNLPIKIVRALRELDTDNEIVHLRDKYKESTPDIVWISNLSKEGDWKIITQDYGILSKPHECHAWKESKLVIYFLKPGWRDLLLWDKAYKIIKIWPSIINHRIKNRIYAYSINIAGTKIDPINT